MEGFRGNPAHPYHITMELDGGCRCIDVNTEMKSTVSEKTANDILQGNIDNQLSLIVDGLSIKAEAWDFRHLIQMKGYGY